ncbi:LysR family transcriptional regulator [Ewingella americana]|uniref:LysR family transcriptional regulator n=1 Tax=Ewingella americana TaxID=41202 RepID=UPI003C6D1E13
MEWSDIRIFLALTRTGTFGAAARSLGVSHPTVARRLQTLSACQMPAPYSAPIVVTCKRKCVQKVLG